MTTTTPSTHSHSSIHIWSALISAFVVSMFFFYIDEGYYDFRWMKSTGNWIVFVVYIGMLFPLPYVLSRFLFKHETGWKKLFIDNLIAIPLISAIFLTLFFSFS